MQRTANDIANLDNYLTGANYKVLLGFNEPDISSQANMDVATAVTLWNQYILPAGNKNSLRLGSPAISNGGNDLPMAPTIHE